MTSKRKATEIDGFRTLIEVDDDGEYLLVVDLDRNQLRQEIQNFNSSGEMNATSFKRPIGVSGKSYQGRVEKKTLDSMGKKVDLGGIAVGRVHCRRGS
ncbi:predicted protein [Botrytis cinerea T4]|uniref:DUF7726 domain-containing protein n=1 Tax=Botryotinia fuckeliana (strain T4) TaxID=999810 RepID=G2Y1N8_BOTF4|nr:predicted protein [Botrytis cinerea T4]